MGNTAVQNWADALDSAPQELTDSEILERYGTLMEGAVSAFRQDPSYIVQMAEAAASLKSKRQARALRMVS